MTTVRDTLTDPARLREIADLDLCADDLGPELDALAREAAEALDLPIGMVGVMLDDALFLPGLHGGPEMLAEARGIPSEWAFCRHTVHGDGPFAVEDAAVHPLMADSPVVRFDGARCYLGVPVVTGAGHAVGTVCVVGVEPRSFSPRDVAVLEELAARAAAHLEARRPAVAG
jgi:GAF domain-containing protein